MYLIFFQMNWSHRTTARMTTHWLLTSVRVMVWSFGQVYHIVTQHHSDQCDLTPLISSFDFNQILCLTLMLIVITDRPVLSRDSTTANSQQMVSLSEQNLIDCSKSYGNDGFEGRLVDNECRFIKEDTAISYSYEAVDNKPP